MAQKPSYEELENRIKQLEHIVLGTKQSDKRLLSIMSEAERLANFGAWEWDMVQDKWTMSDNWLKIHGCKNKVLTTEDLLTIAHPDDINKIQEAFSQCINHGNPYEIEHRIINHETKEVRYIRAYGRVQYDSAGKPVKLCGAAQDITEYKRQEIELNQSEEQYRTLVERTLDLVTKVDSEGQIVFVNHAAQNVYGIPPEECLGRSAFDFIHPEDRDATVTSFNSWLRCPDSALTYENRIVSIDGQRTHHMLWMILPERDESGSIYGFAGTARDITDQKQAEEENKRLENQLQQSHKIESIGQLAGGIAHEFNNLLAVIIGNLELLKLKHQSGAPFDKNLTHVIQASTRAKDLVAQILTFSRQEKPSLVAADLSTIVNDAIRFLRPMIPTTVEVMTVASTDDLPIQADATQLQQVLINICNNAVHAMNEKGLLHINLDEEELTSQKFPQISESQSGRYAKLSITDTGEGMDNQTLKRIFDPFFTTKGVGVGTGMGLSVVHGIVEQHGGIILVDSTPGKGSTFTLYFPITSNDEVAEEVKDEEALPTGTERVLFVDDEPFVADSCGSLLEDPLGYKVTVMTDSIEALDLFKAHSQDFDLVITDQTMPKMSGVELAKELLSIRPELPVILCSGYSAQVSEDVAKEVGISAFCLKPLMMKQLALVVREVLDASK